MTDYKKKLIEVAIPLDAINREAAREKSIRHGHPSTLHLWWARRPLAACRAVLFAQLVDDPSAHPELFPTPDAQEAERERLFRIIEDLVKWENTTNERVLDAARAEIMRSCDGNPPPIVDPFAGGGSIPLEAQRLGLEAHASDLNPVAVLINKALIEIPPRWAGRPPVHPSDGSTLDNRTWTGAQGLADDVRYYGKWMRDEAERRIGRLYPKAKLPDGSEATVIAWIWARTVTCPNPTCGATMPLVRSFWLEKRKGKEAWCNPIVEGRGVRFEIGHGREGPPSDGTVTRTGASCLICESPVPLEYVRIEGREGRMGAQMMAIVAGGDRRRVYLAPTGDQMKAAWIDRPEEAPIGELSRHPQYMGAPRYGLTEVSDLFTNRQLKALCTFSELVGEARAFIAADAAHAGLAQSEILQLEGDVATYLAFMVSKATNLWSSIASWMNDRGAFRETFARQAVPMVWDFAEANPFSGAGGGFDLFIDKIAQTVAAVPATGLAAVTQADASAASICEGVLSTDPPYYDNVPYADLSDFFYVWLRQSLRDIYPDLLGTMLTPKSEELVANHLRFGGSREMAKDFFEAGFVGTFKHAVARQRVGFPMTIFYAFKQSEHDQTDGIASTGWETMLQGLMTAGLAVTGTWPVRTEGEGRMRGQGSNALASSIVLVCRPRHETAGVTDRAGFLNALRSELPEQLRVLQLAAIAPVDLAQASIGPGMAVFSRYAKVIEPSGDAMRVRTALGLINQVLSEVLDQQDGELDADTRWALRWFEQRGFDEGPYGEAEVLATATGVSIDGLVKGGILASSAGKVRLLERAELPDDWDPATDSRVSVWEATQHLVKALDEHSESAAAELLARLGGVGDSAQLLAYRLYAICERKGWAQEAIPFNALAAVWSSLRTHTVEIRPEQGTML